MTCMQLNLKDFNFGADLHCFQQGPLNLVLDVVSGAIHHFDPVAWDLLAALEKHAGDTEAALAELTAPSHPGLYRESELQEALVELNDLVAEGTLFNRDPWRKELSIKPGDGAETSFSSGVAAQLEGLVQAPVIKSLCLNVAHACNLRCGYCFASTGNFGGANKLMPFAVGKAALDFLVHHSANRQHCEVDFFGGEPLLNFAVVQQIVAYGRALEQKTGKQFHFTLTTNAILLDKAIRDYLNEQEISVVLSLDGRPEVHDQWRVGVDGSGSYTEALPRILALTESREDHEDYYVRGTYTRFNLDFSADVLHLADLGFKRVSVEPVVAMEGDAYALRTADLSQIFTEYERLAELIREREKEGRGFNFFHFDLSLEHGPCLPKRLKGCGAGHEYVAVTPEGDIYPCHQFVGRTEYLMGNVLEKQIPNQTLVKSFQQANIYGKPVCAQCWARFHCGGGCHANAEQFNGTIYQPYTLGCAIQKKRLEIAIYIQACRWLENQRGSMVAP